MKRLCIYAICDSVHTYNTSSSQTKNKDPIDLPNTIGTYSSPKCSRIKLEITKGIEEGLQNIKVLTVR